MTDFASVRQARDEIVCDYVKRFKDTKNGCFNLSVSDVDLADLCFRGLRSSIREKIEGYEYFSVSQVLLGALVVEIQINKEK